MSASNPEANVAMAGASQLRARVIQAAMSAAASSSAMRETSRSTVARLAGMWRCARRRAPPAPPQARPTLACASQSRRVRRACGARRSVGVCAKVRRRQAGLRQ